MVLIPISITVLPTRCCGEMGSKWSTRSKNKCILQSGGGQKEMMPGENRYPYTFAQNILKTGIYVKNTARFMIGCSTTFISLVNNKAYCENNDDTFRDLLSFPVLLPIAVQFSDTFYNY